MGRCTKGYTMSKVYQLSSDYENYSIFLEKYTNIKNSFIYKYWEWETIELKNYDPVIFELHASGNGKKNYKMDVCTFVGGIVILSEKAVESLKEILKQSGQIIPIVTPSKRKKFYGFYPSRNVYDLSIVNLSKSSYTEAERGKIFYRIALNNKYPKDDYIFVLKEHAMRSFVTEKFKTVVEEAGLVGFDFSVGQEIIVDYSE